MKKLALLNSELSRVIASLGHHDLLVLADAGHAIPRDADRIDIALRPGIPAIVDVLETVLTEMRVEAYIVCDQVVEANPALVAEYERGAAGRGTTCPFLRGVSRFGPRGEGGRAHWRILGARQRHPSRHRYRVERCPGDL